ncbi:MAG: hypothetical protein L0227_10710, partial [Chloroflexi bacterium]|nr:hypothetical protein [Chloroflexota bacterium]
EACAYRTPDDLLPARGWSWLALPGSTPYTKGSELENTETSAWGRAIGALGIGIASGIASADEVQAKADRDGRDPGGLIGIAEVGKGDADFELRQTPAGHRVAFRLREGRRTIKIVAVDPLASALHQIREQVVGQRVTCFGSVQDDSFVNRAGRLISYRVMELARIETADWTLPSSASLPDVPTLTDEDSVELDAIADGLTPEPVA